MRNIKLTIEYDGSRYQGWSRLGKNESNNTISNKLQEVLRKMTGEFLIELYCGCRTEAGVPDAVPYPAPGRPPRRPAFSAQRPAPATAPWR